MKGFFSFTLWVILASPLWSQTMSDTITNQFAETAVIIDGQATEACWTNAGWQYIDQVWMPYNATMQMGDFEGRFKVAWDRNYLYILVEVVDDMLSDDHSDPLINWWDDDCLEIFIDENRSMGDHERNCNAFAYHVSLFYDAIDLDSDGHGINYKDHIEVKMDTLEENIYLWEMAIKIYDETFYPGNPEASRVYLEANKLMGLAVAYCDNDETASRENFIGSMYMTEAQNNDMYKNADHFGPMVLAGPAGPTGLVKETREPGINLYPLPAHDELTLEVPFGVQNSNSIAISTLTGQLLFSESFHGNSHTIHIGDLNAGIYLLQVVNGRDTHTRMFIKQ